MVEWRKVKSLNYLYEVSSFGEVRNVRTKKVLKLFKCHSGYYHFTARPEKNKPKTVRVHRIVAEAFLGECPCGYVVNHIDGDKTNNKVENLEYVTPSENNLHALRNGLRKPAEMKKYARRGEQHYRAKITEDDVRYILQLHKETGFGCRRLGKLTGISHGTIGGILSGKTWKHITQKEDK